MFKFRHWYPKGSVRKDQVGTALYLCWERLRKGRGCGLRVDGNGSRDGTGTQPSEMTLLGPDWLAALSSSLQASVSPPDHKGVDLDVLAGPCQLAGPSWGRGTGNGAERQSEQAEAWSPGPSARLFVAHGLGRPHPMPSIHSSHPS